jgi:hypothetical protein
MGGPGVAPLRRKVAKFSYETSGYELIAETSGNND